MERHVALAEQFPFLKRPDSVRHNVLQAGDWLERLDPDDQTAVAALLDQDATPPADALKVLVRLQEPMASVLRVRGDLENKFAHG